MPVWCPFSECLRAKCLPVRDRFDTIHTRHWHQLAMKNGGPVVWDAMVDLVAQVGPALAAVESRLPKDFHGRSWDAISKGMVAEAERFLVGVDGL